MLLTVHILCCQKTVCFLEQVMSVDKYPSIFSHQTDATVYIVQYNDKVGGNKRKIS